MKPKKLIKFRHSLKVDVSGDSIVQDIIDDVKRQIGDKLEHYKYNVQIIIDVCEYVEDNVQKRSKGKKQLSKKDVVLKVFSDLYPDIDLNFVENAIESIFDNKIVTGSLGKRILRFIGNLFLRK